MARFYHSVNTRYNIHFNAEEAYKEALKRQNETREDNLSEMLYIFPDNSDSTSLQFGGSFTTTIDKTTKAIKSHSIKTKPRRDPNRRNDPGYQAWLQQKEYTPFMDQVWLLLGKAEFHDGNYLRAITTFMYISKIYSSNPEIVAECQLWVARAYSEMGWMYEAGNILHKMELVGGVPEKQKTFYSEVKANYLIRNKEYNEAIPYLEYSIKKEKEKTQKLRMKYLLGQLYEEIGDKSSAYQAYGSIKGMNTPYKYTFNAKLRQLQLDSSKGEHNLVAELQKMGKSSKNKEYQDQIYYTIGNIYLNNMDSTRAIDNYRKAVAASTRNGYDKMLAEIKLADIYFDRREFVAAQPFYSSALTHIKKTNPAYPRVFKRSDVLDELVVHVKTLQEQDSLQYLAGLPETERLQIISSKIEELKKQEEEKARQEERERQKEERESRVIQTWGDLDSEIESKSSITQVANPATVDNSKVSFYFYNEQAVNQGKIAFQRQWGNRKLEDDWRRSDKLGFVSDLAELPEMEKENENLPSDEEESEKKELVEDIYSAEYYLQQLPLTEVAMQQSNALIENALFNMGKIYKDKLQDADLAIEAFEADIRRFPHTPNLEEIYYQLLLIYMQMGDRNMMANYRNRLLSEFPQGKYATPLSDANYEWNFRRLPILQDSLYTSAYDAYMQVDVQTVRNNFKEMNDKYPFTDLMPKFALLNALSYAQTRDIKGLESNLKELADKYPKADVTPLATEILDRIKDGKIILSDGTPILEFDWSGAYLADNVLTAEDGEILGFSEDLDREYLLLLMFKSNTIDRNGLLYEVADYNFSNYVIQTFDLNYATDGAYDVLQIKGFATFANIKSYLDKALGAGGLLTKIDENIEVVPISVNNYVNVLPRIGMEQYTIYFSKEFESLLPDFIAFWHNKKEVIGEMSKIPDLAENADQDKGKPVMTDQRQEEKQEALKEGERVEEVRPVEEKKEEIAQPVISDKQITAEDLLTKEQQEAMDRVTGVVEDVGNILSNPVDGIKNLFNRRKYKDNLTKEEKEALKEEKKLEKQHRKDLKAIEKARQDSIVRMEKTVQDSLKAIEKGIEQQKRQEEKQKKEAERAAIEAKEAEKKQKEDERKEKERLQKERLRQQEQERKEKAKTREAERKERERSQKERQRQREQERKEKEKVQEKVRKEREKEAENRRRQNEK